MIKQPERATKTNVQGGPEEVHFEYIASEEELLGAARLYARITVPKGSGIGVHTHTGETEPYFILSGTGIFTDCDGIEKPVKAGDVCAILPGQSHGIRNEADEDLVFMALIHFDINGK